MTGSDELTQDRLAGRRYGPSAGPDAVRLPLWLLFFAVLVALRLCPLLPFTDTDAMVTHARIVDSLAQGRTWGRQALIGSFEFPPLQTLSLLLASFVAAPLRVGPGRLLVAISQAWALCYFLRIPCGPKRSWLGLACLGCLLWVPDTQAAFLALDPGWVMLVPVSSAVYHAARWHRYRSLRDMIICAIDCGILVFAGVAGIVFAAAMLALMSSEVRRAVDLSAGEKKGMRLLAWVPFCYCAILWLLWNWLIMGDMLFPLYRLVEAFRSVDAQELVRGVQAATSKLSPFVVGGGVVLAVSFFSQARATALCLFAGLAAATVCQVLLTAVYVYPAGATLLVLGVGLLGLAFPLLTLDWQANAGRLGVGCVLFIASACTALLRPAAVHAEESAYMIPHPPVRAITDWIDRFWPDSRVLVYGVRVAALYHDPAERRFLARLDFREADFLEQAGEEQIHLLVPPRTGRFYARESGLLSDIFQHGRTWLFLERRWPSGWQLWRCVVPPVGESKLQQLE